MRPPGAVGSWPTARWTLSRPGTLHTEERNYYFFFNKKKKFFLQFNLRKKLLLLG